ncbi:MAG TPA: 3-isopropylmalate dehydratase small subunit [Bacteroidales bacterium]|nr:3-isopropylmalate dehydratase small subunit [Bacteroidales bacterium]
MSNSKFTVLESTCVPVPYENVDTDQIIPARFLTATSREGFGENLFRDWRYDKNGVKNSDCILNDSRYRGEILVAGKNFGCGSSREHAVWAVQDHGFKAVLSSFFADIFKNNALNNGLLPVVIPPKILDELMSLVLAEPDTRLRIDLREQLLTIIPVDLAVRFEINPYRKDCLLNGLDDIDYLLGLKDNITDFENRKKVVI